MHIFFLSCAFLLLAGSALACKLDSDCGSYAKCSENEICLVPAQCQRHRDCLHKGLYYECVNLNCMVSDHKICRSDDDCRKNWINTKCENDRCTRTFLKDI